MQYISSLVMKRREKKAVDGALGSGTHAPTRLPRPIPRQRSPPHTVPKINGQVVSDQHQVFRTGGLSGVWGGDGAGGECGGGARGGGEAQHARPPSRLLTWRFKANKSTLSSL